MGTNKKRIENEETNFVSAILFRYLPYWPLFIVLILGGVVTAWIYLRYATPLYEVEATILIKDEKKGVDETNVLEALNIYTSKKIVENEIEVIHSRKLMKEVVKQLHLYSPVFESGNVIAFSAYETSPITIEARNPENLQETTDIYFSIRGDKEIIINDKPYPFQWWVSTPYGELRFVRNTKKIREALNPLFFRLYNPKDMAAALLLKLTVTASSKQSTVANLKLKDEVPQRGEDILNKLVSTYNKSSIDAKNTLAANTLTFVETRLKGVEKELDSLEGRIEQYRSKKGAVDLSEQGKLFLQNVGSNDRKVSDLSMQLAVLDQVETYVNSKDSESVLVPSSLGIDDPVLSQLMQRLYNAKLEYEKLRETTGDKNPIVITVAKEIEQIRPHILEKIRNQRMNLQASRSNLNSTSGMYDIMLRAIPQKERELTEISRQQTIKNNIYSFLLEKREETALAISSTVADSRVVDVGESTTDPVSPKTAFVLLAALVVPITLGVGLISAKELFNRKILFRSELESFTHVPVIAEISYTKEKESLSNTSSKISEVAEQFRQLRAAMGLFGKNKDSNKNLLVTSSISGEGKSYISTNLAISLALTGKKVVLVDLDIRNPKASSLLGVSRKPGVAEFLEGTRRPEEIIHATNYTNLSTVGAGCAMDNTRELILSGNLNVLFAYLNMHFDYIITDTSPIDPVADAYVFSEYCDTTLVVVRHGYTPKSMVKLLDSSQKIRALKNPSIVFNDVKSRGLFKGKYGYGYGYGYNYENMNKDEADKKDRIYLEA